MVGMVIVPRTSHVLPAATTSTVRSRVFSPLFSLMLTFRRLVGSFSFSLTTSGLNPKKPCLGDAVEWLDGETFRQLLNGRSPPARAQFGRHGYNCPRADMSYFANGCIRLLLPWEPCSQEWIRGIVVWGSSDRKLAMDDTSAIARLEEMCRSCMYALCPRAALHS